jgi:hypothetical protein
MQVIKDESYPGCMGVTINSSGGKHREVILVLPMKGLKRYNGPGKLIPHITENDTDNWKETM